MILKSRFDINEEVIFYNAKKMKLEAGNIYSYHACVSNNGEVTWRYSIAPKKESERIFRALIHIEDEQFIYKNREEAMEFALRFTAGI